MPERTLLSETQFETENLILGILLWGLSFNSKTKIILPCYYLAGLFVSLVCLAGVY